MFVVRAESAKTAIILHPRNIPAIWYVHVCALHYHPLFPSPQTYNLMSGRWFTHASPTLFNAGTCRPQLSSCFLICMKDDSIDGIYDTLKTCANISKSAGGIGIATSCIRASGSYIAGVSEMEAAFTRSTTPLIFPLRRCSLK